MIKKIFNRIIFEYKRIILRDPQNQAFHKWFKDKGDLALRSNYPLNKDSVVFDLGGYHGDFAEEIVRKFDCTVFVFEPVPDFYQICIERFKNNPKIKCFNFGLSKDDEYLEINLDENASSFVKKGTNKSTLKVELKSITDFIKKFDIKFINLLKINIEGGEFDILPALISSGDIYKIDYLQIQFHKFVPNALSLRNQIRLSLQTSHQEQWNYEFVWESWKKIE